MFNFLKSTFAPKSASSDAEALVEEFAGQDGRLYPFDLKNFTAGVKFQNAEPQMQHDIVMAMVAWFENRPSNLINRYDNKEWQLRWKMREVLSRMLKHKLPFTEQEVAALLNWPADHRQFYYLGVPQRIKIASDYLKDNTISDDLYKAMNSTRKCNRYMVEHLEGCFETQGFARSEIQL